MASGPAAETTYPVARLALQRTVRLVATARLRDPVLLGLVDRELLDDLAEIEGAKSGRLLAQRHGGEPRRKIERRAGRPRRDG